MDDVQSVVPKTSRMAGFGAPFYPSEISADASPPLIPRRHGNLTRR
ncbi:MAG: hypothetical protein JO229_01305 [Alphaproteobacteria bacterium]|nr:hypothetical protein [Alphaproteobacteria bacterium]